jgi:lipoprotein-releasing system permease protein
VGFFNVQPEINAQYMLAPLWFVQDLLHYDHQISALEIGTAPQAKLPQITAQIRRILGNNYDIKDRYEQQDAVYKIFKIEKWAAFFILTFIVLISALNLVGLLTMLVIDKKNDIHILRAMGATKPMVRQIFIVEGLMITLTGAILGVGVGVAACWAQQKFGLITFETNGSFIVDFYPVQVQWLDIVAVFAMVLGVGLVCSIYPAKQAA